MDEKRRLLLSAAPGVLLSRGTAAPSLPVTGSEHWARKPGPNGEGIGTYGWGGAASTIAWVDRARGIRASGWSQIFGTPPAGDIFSAGFGKAVYASL